METQIEQITILQNFIKLLRFIEGNDAKLTSTGNFNLKTIATIGEILELPEHFKEHPIKSEFEWRELDYLDVLSQITKLAVNRNHFRRLTKHGQDFLKLQPQEQFLFLFRAYWEILNWDYLFPYTKNEKDNPACHLQRSRSFVLQTMWEKQKNDGWIDFMEFAEYLRVSLNLKLINYRGDDLPYRIHDCIEEVIIEQFGKFGLLKVNYKIVKKFEHDFQEIDSFRLTDLGKRVVLALLFPLETHPSSSNKLCLLKSIGNSVLLGVR